MDWSRVQASCHRHYSCRKRKKEKKARLIQKNKNKALIFLQVLGRAGALSCRGDVRHQVFFLLILDGNVKLSVYMSFFLVYTVLFLQSFTP